MSTAPTIRPPFGYVAPANKNGEFNDAILNQFLNTLVVGLTGLPGPLVRPRWQPEPPNEPDFNTDWSAIGVVRRTRDVFAFQGSIHVGDALTPMQRVIRNQILETIASFYGPNAESNSELFAMGLSEAQNREGLFLNGFGLVEVQESLTVPALIKERWLSGVDVPFRMRRQQIYDYPNPDLAAANGTLTLDDGTVIDLNVVRRS
jgi:hypothetical protein